MKDIKTGQTAVATFSDREKAEQVSDRLHGVGILAEVFDESKWQKYWYASKPLAGEKVVVSEKDFERARMVLEAADAQEHQHLLQGEIKCPQCDSPDVQYPQFTRKFITTTMVEVLCFLHIIDKTFYCKKCHNTWPASTVLRSKTDILNWPTERGGLVKNEKG